MAAEAITRRTLTARSLKLAAVAATPAALAASVRAGRAQAQTPDDVLLTGAIALEQTLIALYGAALDSGLLDSAQSDLARTFRNHAGVHVKALSQTLSEFTPRPDGGALLPGLGRVGSARRYLELALGFENQAYLAYLDAVGPLESAQARRLIASLAASTAQHLALLRAELGRTPVTGAFETGSRD